MEKHLVKSTGFKAPAIIRNFDKVADAFDDNNFLFDEINKRQLSRLKFIKIKPKTILDLGCGTGTATQYLLKNYKNARVVCADISPNMLKRAKMKKTWRQKIFYAQADAANLPFKKNQFDFVYSNLMLHWCSDITKVIQEWQRVLKPDGLLMFSAFGPDTLKELREVLALIRPNHITHSYVDMHDLGDILLKNHFSNPVMDVDNIKLHYSSAEPLIKELRSVGGRNLNTARAQHCFGKGFLFKLKNTLQQLQGHKELQLSFEIIYGHAFASQLSQQNLSEGVATIPLNALKISRPK